MTLGKTLECHMVDNAHKDTFKDAGKQFKYIPGNVIFRNKKNDTTEKTTEQMAAKVKGLLQKEEEKRERMKELGFNYDFPGYAALIA